MLELCLSVIIVVCYLSVAYKTYDNLVRCANKIGEEPKKKMFVLFALRWPITAAEKQLEWAMSLTPGKVKDEYNDGLSHLAGLVSESCGDVSWEERASRIKRISEEVSFGCGFMYGVCVGAEGIEQCCCHGCFLGRGYLEFIPKDKISSVLVKFKPVYGFWTPEGCSLPPELRSDLCHHYVCPSVAGYNEKREKVKNILAGK